jgi:hypothetical protein
MSLYEQFAFAELSAWEVKVRKKPSVPNRVAKFFQTKLNNLIPDRVHQAITFAIEKMVKGVLFGSRYLTARPLEKAPLQIREIQVRKKIERYKKAASAEGAVTGAGGILMGFADFPALMAIKIQLLFEMAALYGYQVKDYKERLFILHIFQLAFSSQRGRNEIIELIADWDHYSQTLSEEVDDFDWRNFQLEYRDYIDLAKMAQLIPIIGAGVGAIANYKLVQLLGDTAMNCYRMRYFRSMEIDGGEQ